MGGQHAIRLGLWVQFEAKQLRMGKTLIRHRQPQRSGI